MGLVLDWKKKLGYSKDPFEAEMSGPAQHYLVGLGAQQEKFNLFLIKGHSYGTITGEHGSGKTLFARWIAQALGSGAYKAILLDGKNAAKSQELADSILEHTTSFLTRKMTLKKAPEQRNEELFKLLAKGKFVILVDNAGHLGRESTLLLAEITKHANVSVILIDTPERIKRLEMPLTDQLQISTPKYTQDHLIDMLGRRIQLVGGAGTFPFDAEHLTTLVKRSDGSPAKLLTLARERAIELSLKVASPPKQSLVAVRSSAAVPAVAAPKRKLFAIKFEREKKEGEESAPFLMETTPQEHHDTTPEPSAEHHDDAAKLLEIMQHVEDHAPSQPTRETNYDAVIKKAAKEFEPRKAATKKKSAAKKKR